MALSAKRKAFVEHYLRCWNGTEAARLAGYTERSAHVQASRLLRNDKVQAAIQERLNELKMSADEVLVRLAEQARSTMEDFVNPELETVSLSRAEARGKLHLVKKFSRTKTDKSENISIELYDAQSALVQIGRFHSLFVESPPEVASGEGDDSGPFTLPADAIAAPFLAAYRDIRDHRHTEYLLYGGRGSTKSSFVSLVMVWLIVNNPEMHGLAVRHVANTLRDSVYSQICWAIDTLGLTDQFGRAKSPLEITYLPTGQRIYFRGADDPLKIKSIKPSFGYIGGLWFEELDQFAGPEAVRSIEQSAIRKGDWAVIFKTYNPPPTRANWANEYATIPKASQFQHKSTYLDVPEEWLGRVFLDEALHLKEINPTAYAHEYLGEVTGTGGDVFENLELRAITDAEIEQFDRPLQGLDWGYFPDPFAWNKMHYDAARMTLYLYDELRLHKAGNEEAARALMEEKGVQPGDQIICDSAEPKSVADFRALGLNARGAEKGADSVPYSMKWLQRLAKIVIDPARCPHTAREFERYEYEQDKDGRYISAYPDRDNHHIDAVRYGTNLIWRRKGQ